MRSNKYDVALLGRTKSTVQVMRGRTETFEVRRKRHRRVSSVEHLVAALRLPATRTYGSGSSAVVDLNAALRLISPDHQDANQRNQYETCNSPRHLSDVREKSLFGK